MLSSGWRSRYSSLPDSNCDILTEISISFPTLSSASYLWYRKLATALIPCSLVRSTMLRHTLSFGPHTVAIGNFWLNPIFPKLACLAFFWAFSSCSLDRPVIGIEYVICCAAQKVVWAWSASFLLSLWDKVSPARKLLFRCNLSACFVVPLSWWTHQHSQRFIA